MEPARIRVLKQPIELQLSGKNIPNRIYRSALSEGAATFDVNDRAKCGPPLPELEAMYREFAEGGAGLICSGNIPIDRDYLEKKGNAILDRRNLWDAVEAFRPCITAAKSKGAIFLAQLQHPGRQRPESLSTMAVSASDIQLQPCMDKTYAKPRALTIQEIRGIIKSYVWAAERLYEAGADGLILHACHGYLISQFLSPLTNTRTDEYGGSLLSRAKFLLEIIGSIQSRLPSDRFVIALKNNCHDYTDGGVTFNDTLTHLPPLERAGIDFFDVSGGTYATPAWRGPPLYEFEPNTPSARSVVENGSFFLPYAREMKKVLTRAVLGTTGGWRDVYKMGGAVQNSEIDCVGLGRVLLANPDFPRKAMTGVVKTAKL